MLQTSTTTSAPTQWPLLETDTRFNWSNGFGFKIFVSLNQEQLSLTSVSEMRDKTAIGLFFKSVSYFLMTDREIRRNDKHVVVGAPYNIHMCFTNFFLMWAQFPFLLLLFLLLSMLSLWVLLSRPGCRDNHLILHRHCEASLPKSICFKWRAASAATWVLKPK